MPVRLSGEIFSPHLSQRGVAFDRAPASWNKERAPSRRAGVSWASHLADPNRPHPSVAAGANLMDNGIGRYFGYSISNIVSTMTGVPIGALCTP